MTVIAWDGISLASDRLGDQCDLSRSATKIFRFDGGLFGAAGSASKIAHMFEWLKYGADPLTIPSSQMSDDYQSIMVVRNSGEVWLYAQSPFPYRMEDKFHAIGSGRDFAIAAMHLGKTAREAVEVASIYCLSCGNGIDELRLK